MKGLRVRIAIVVAVACAALVPIAVASRGGDGDPAPREIRVVARDMTYYINGQQAPNPTLTFKAGERIRLVLRNEDGGMTHDFVIKEWDVATKTLDEKGQEDAVVFRVPNRRSTTAYQCTPHSEMMRGSVQVN
jgi:plastocyanin